MPDNKSLAPPDGSSGTGGGSGVMIGDGIMLTAGHVMYEFNENNTNRQIRHLSGASSFYDPRNYYSQYASRVAALSNPLPTPNPSIPSSFSGQFIEIHLRTSDMVFVDYGGNVGKNDAGMAVYLDSSDIASADFGLTSGTKFKRWGMTTGTKEVSSGYLAVDSVGLLITDTGAITLPGDSGGGNWIDFEGKEFIVGNNVSSNQTTESHSSYISSAEFYTLNDMLAYRQATGDVSGSEPTNLIVGRATADTGSGAAKGTYRPDIVLGRGGNDELSDGDMSFWWASDRLFGGDGDDGLTAGNGDDLLHGGDFRDYTGSGRTSLENDGDDTVQYETAGSRNLHGVGLTVLIGPASSVGAPAWTFGTIDAGDKSAAIFVLDQISPSAEISFGNDTLISIEHIKLTDVDDVVRLDVIEGAQFAGSDGKGGVAEIKMEGNATGFGKGDLIDASLNSTNLSIDLAATSSNVKARDDSSGDKSLTILGAERVWGGSGDDIIKGNEKDNEIKGGGGTDTVNYGDGTVPITISYSSFGDDALISVADGLGGTDQLSEIEKIIGSSGNDIFSFEGLIPTNSNLTIDGGGGLHDKISLEEAVNAGGMKLVITDKGSGDGYIMNRNGADGVIYVKNFHTDIVGSDYSDIISDESSGDHTIDAGDGDDNITVGGSGATVDGGAGNDVILLKSASATIKFGGGGGHDVVNFDDVDGAYDLALQGLNPDDVELIAGGRNVYANFSGGEDGNGFHVQFIAVRIISTGDTITFLENGKNIGPNGNGSSISYGVDSRKLDSISFADGTVWTREGDDVYFSLGSWVTQDFWGYKHEYPGVDRPLYHTPDSYVDYVNTTYLQADPIGAPPPPPDQNHPGTSGDDDLKPGRGNDTVEGSAGNDRVRESRGDDTYKWNVGDGDDIIWGAGALDGFNTLELGAGILPTDLQFAVSDYGAGLTITFAGKTGSVTLSGALVGDGFGVDQIRFADNTILSRADLIAAASSEIAAAQTFENGTSSSDFIYAPAGNFVIDAGEGDDFISVEGAGAGTFLFSSADGHDQISDYGFGYSRNDTLVLTDANAADITLSRSGDSLLLTINSTGATVDITSQFTDDDGDIHGINTLKFADNTTWTRLQIRDAALGTESGTSPIAEAATAAVVEDGAIIRGTLVASDADDGDVLTFSLDNQIAGLALAANGNWSFDATNAAYQHLSQGEELILTVNYHVTDAAGLTSASTLTLTLTGTSTMPLVEQELINQRLADNAAFAYDVTGSFSDPEGDPLVFTAQLANGSELPTWLTFEDGQFEGTAPIGTSGVLNVVVTAANGVLETSSAFRLHFGPDNEAPAVSAPLPDIMGGVDDSLDISVSSFIDPDGDLVAVSAALADDSPLPTWLSLENGRLIGTPPVTAFGNTYAIKITATDGEDEGGAQFSITIGRRIVTGTSGDDEFELSTLFDVTGGQGRDRYGVVGNGEGVFYYSRGDGWDGLYSLDEGVRADKLIFTDISSDELSLYRYEDSAIFFVDDSNDFWGGNQFSGDNPGGVNQGFEHVQFSDSVTWDRDEIRNRANAPEIILDISDPSETGSSVSEAFVMESGLGAGTIDDFEVAGANHDYLQFDRSQFDSWAHLLGATTQQGSDLLIDLGGGDSVTLTDVSISAFTSLNVRFFGSASV